MTDRCEPPEHLRGVDGWHWATPGPIDAAEPMKWNARQTNWHAVGCALASDLYAVRWKWRYHSPVLTPAEADALRAENARLREALEGIAQWCEAYPAKVFPQANADRALALCKEANIPVDAMHGTWARHLLEGIGRDARSALEPKP